MARKLTQLLPKNRNRINLSLSISLSDAILYGCFIAAVLAIFLEWSFITRAMEQYSYEKTISHIEKRLDALTALSQNKKKAEASTSPNNFESIPLLNLEKCALELEKKEHSFSEIQALRHQFIFHENSFSFKRGKTTDNGLFHEVELKLQHTVQVDEDDLQTVLQKIDSSPSLRIKKFHLEKEKNLPCYSLYLELWDKSRSP